MIQDSVEALRPDLQLFKSHQEAVEAAIELEKKYKDKIGKFVDDYIHVGRGWRKGRRERERRGKREGN